MAVGFSLAPLDSACEGIYFPRRAGFDLEGLERRRILEGGESETDSEERRRALV